MSTLDLMRQASKGALSAVKDALGKQTNPILNVYEKLTPADFEHLANVRGPEFVNQFITEAEALRMRGGNNAGK